MGASQAYLTQVPDLVSRLQKWAGAERVLVILDESAFLDAGMRESIRLEEIEKNLNALRAVQQNRGNARIVGRWVDILELMLDPDVGLTELPQPPAVGQALSAQVQEAGLRLYPGAFRYLLFDLAGFSWSPRWRTREAVGYIRRPRLKGHDHVVISAGIPAAVVRQRLNNPDLYEMFAGVRFLSEGSRVYNLRCGLGAAVNFDHNAPQILFATAQLIAKLATEGKRAITVSKKRFAKLAAERLQKYLRELTAQPFRIVINAADGDLADPLVVPLITYGAVGINAYEEFDAAIALNSYNARPEVLDDRMNDAHLPVEEVRVEVDTHDGGRRARAKGHFARLQGFDQLAQQYQAHLEAGVVTQALGRVRFATRPRLVVFFQAGGVPYPLDKEFRNLEQLRAHFGLVTRREWLAHRVGNQARELAARGLSRAQVAAEMQVSERTVSRAHAYPRRGDTKPY